MKKCFLLAVLCSAAILFLYLPSIAGEKVLPQGFSADEIIVLKSARKMMLLKGGDTVKTYRICLGSDPLGPKERQGDGRTPEGSYLIDWRKSKSLYHLALHVSYPNPADRAKARKNHVSPGGMIMIHGLPNGFVAPNDGRPLPDWTDGCIAVTNPEIEEIWRCVRDGTKIIILP